jgi:hypothetical protein
MTLRSRRLGAGLATAATLLCLGSGRRAHGQTTSMASAQDVPAATAWVPRSHGLRFERNRGQLDDRVRFVGRGTGHSLFLTRDGAVLALRRPHDGDGDGDGAAGAVDSQKDSRRSSGGAAFEQSIVTMRVADGRRNVEPVGGARLSSQSNYFVGRQAKWRAGVDQYASVRYAGVRAGIDLVFYGSGDDQLEYDLVLSAGVDPRRAGLSFGGIDSVHVDASGAAVLTASGGGALVLRAPVAYQIAADGTRTTVAVRYVDRGAGRLDFAVGRYDRRRSLIIDPVLTYSTYLGGSGDDEARGVAVDRSGNVYVTGLTASGDFPIAPGPGVSQSKSGGGYDAFVSKYTSAGQLVYSTFMGGGAYDAGDAIAVNPGGIAVVAGATSSADFPTTAGALYQSVRGGLDAFVAKLTPDGSVVFATYLGGAGNDQATGIAMDAFGNAFITGFTDSRSFPVSSSPLQAGSGGYNDAFVSELNATGSALVYSTYLGGNDQDYAYGIALDSSGDAYVTGETFSRNFPIAFALQSTLAGFNDAFVVKIAPGGASLLYATYLGGNDEEEGFGIAVDGAGNAHVAGFTASNDFPTVRPLQSGSGADGFLTKINADGTRFLYSTYLGGSGTDYLNAVAVDPYGGAVVAGGTQSIDLSVSDPIQPALAGGFDAFVARLNQTGSRASFSTYFGGADIDVANAVAVDATSTYVIGKTKSLNLPTLSPVQPSLAGGDGDAFVAKILTPAVPAISRAILAALALLLLVLGARLLAPSRRRTGR